MKGIITILNYIDVIAPLTTLFFLIKPYRYLPREVKFIFWFVCLQLGSNLLATTFEIIHITNYLVYFANVVISFYILSGMFYYMGNRFLKKIVPVGSLLFFGGILISLWYKDGIDSFNSNLSAFGSFSITAYCLIFFYWRLVTDNRHAGLTESALLWMVIGVFTYYTGSFFIFISYQFLLVQEADVIGILWRFHNLLLAIFCAYTIYGITCKNYQKT